MSKERIKVLLAKKKIDVHGRGTKLIARELRDAGMEVVYFRFGVVEEIADAAVQEDVDVVAMSVLSGAHMTLFPRVRELLVDAGADHILLTGGGIIPQDDVEALEEQGVGRLFGPGTPTSAAIDYIQEWFEARETA